MVYVKYQSKDFKKRGGGMLLEIMRKAYLGEGIKE